MRISDWSSDVCSSDLLDYEKKLSATEVMGSFAGAIGLPQFMPGSLIRYAADGDNDGRIDLRYSVDDAITSVARFLRLHGWMPGLPVFAPATLPRDPQAMVVGGLHPSYDRSEEHTSELQSLMRISYAGFCLNK